jgi:hypothetical protein
MTPIDLQDRNYLQSLVNEAWTMGENSINEKWRTAYMKLAEAADRLDAMQARSSTIQSEGRPLNIGTEAGVTPTCACGAPDCECDQHSGCCGDETKNNL